VHAEVERIAGDWAVTDDGLSSNGTFVNGDRVQSRRRLRDGDALRFGATLVQFHDPVGADRPGTVAAGEPLTRASLSPAQKRVLVALCRPLKGSPSYATPATNQSIADELFLSVDAVKTHMRALFTKFGIEDLPQNQKRLRLVELAFQTGLIADRDL
jgi:pSer/pThr/pTyr-binding forkhead associated (FHA) protein